MEITTYIKNLANTTSRSSVMKNLAEVRIAYRESGPVISEASKAIARANDFSPELKQIHTRFNKGKPLTQALDIIVKVAPKFADLLEDKLTSEFESRISNTGLSYRQTQVLMLIETYAFMHRYALRYLSAALDDIDEVPREEKVSPAEYKRLQDEAFAFLRGVEIFDTPIEKLSKLIDDATEAVVDPEAHAVFAAASGGLKIDPLRLGFVDVRFNPFFLVGRWLADKEMEGYFIAKEERESLQLRLIRLNERSARQDTEQLQEQINETEDAIRRRDRKIADMEAKYGG